MLHLHLRKYLTQRATLAAALTLATCQRLLLDLKDRLLNLLVVLILEYLIFFFLLEQDWLLLLWYAPLYLTRLH